MQAAPWGSGWASEEPAFICGPGPVTVWGETGLFGYHQAKGVKSIKDLLRGQEQGRGGRLVSCVKDQMLVSLIPSEAPG